MSAVLIQRRLKEIGISVNIRVLEWASFIGRFIKTGEFDAVVLGWSLSLDPDQYGIWHSSQQAPGQFNFIGYNNPRVDRLLEQGRLELDPDKRMKIYHEFAATLLEDSPIVYLFAGYGLPAIHKRVKGIDNPAPPAGIGHNSYEWYIPAPLRRNEISAQ
jgi:peptide/nickel transport system substrate-binding protein